MFSFLGWLIIGLVAGLLARAIMPGRQPMGLFMTMVLGCVGSFVGGLLSSILFGVDPGQATIHAAGLIGSTIGAFITLALYVRMNAPRTPI